MELFNGLYGHVSIIDKYNRTFNRNNNLSYINSILNIENETNNLGLAHGLSGQLLMELELSKSHFNLNRIKKLQKRIVSKFSTSKKNWTDHRNGSYNSHFWCNGGLGISSILHKSLKHSASEDIKMVLDMYNTNTGVQYKYSHICCGSGSQILKKNAIRKEEFPFEEDIGITNYSFFNGCSGTDYYKSLNNPNILLLED